MKCGTLFGLWFGGCIWSCNWLNWVGMNSAWALLGSWVDMKRRKKIEKGREKGMSGENVLNIVSGMNE